MKRAETEHATVVLLCSTDAGKNVYQNINKGQRLGEAVAGQGLDQAVVVSLCNTDAGKSTSRMLMRAWGLDQAAVVFLCSTGAGKNKYLSIRRARDWTNQMLIAWPARTHRARQCSVQSLLCSMLFGKQSIILTGDLLFPCLPACSEPCAQVYQPQITTLGKLVDEPQSMALSASFDGLILWSYQPLEEFMALVNPWIHTCSLLTHTRTRTNTNKHTCAHAPAGPQSQPGAPLGPSLPTQTLSAPQNTAGLSRVQQRAHPCKQQPDCVRGWAQRLEDIPSAFINT
eukprot:1157601-Pelagomonas_calceolata.AAC.3